MKQGEGPSVGRREKSWFTVDFVTEADGRTLHTRYEKDGSHAEFKTILKNGLVVSIEGDNMGVKDLRGFMSQVDLNALESLQRKGKS